MSASFPRRASPTSFYVETLGCPKNAVDSDKVVASLLADGLVATVGPVRGRPRRREHVRVHRGGPPGVDRRRRSRWPTPKRAGAKLVVTGCMAERYGDELAAALPEADAVVGFAGEGVDRRRRARAEAQAGRCPRPARAAAARAERAVGLREGRRGLRPRVRVLRDPVVPRQAAVAHAGVDRGRGARARRGAASPRSCSSRRTSRGTAATSASPVRSRRCCAGSTRSRRTVWRASGCSTSTRRRCTTRSSRTMLELPTVVPYFDLSLQHAAPGLLRRMKRWGSGDRFLAMIEGIRAQEPDAAFRSSFIVGFPGETESRPRRAARVPRRRARSTGPASSRSRSEDGTAGRDDGRRGRRRRSCASGCGECAEVQDPITNASRARAGRRDGRGARRRGRRRRRARRPHATARRPRSTASSGSSASDADPACSRARARSCTATVCGVAGPDLEATPDVDAPVGARVAA